MIRIKPLSSLDELIPLWPRLTSLVKDGIDSAALLSLTLLCLDEGAVFLVYNDRGLAGACCVSTRDNTAILHTLPTDSGEQLGKTCLKAVVEWAISNDIKRLQVTSNRLCGSSYRYFEKSLGFRRKSVTFTKEL